MLLQPWVETVEVRGQQIGGRAEHHQFLGAELDRTLLHLTERPATVQANPRLMEVLHHGERELELRGDLVGRTLALQRSLLLLNLGRQFVDLVAHQAQLTVLLGLVGAGDHKSNSGSFSFHGTGSNFSCVTLTSHA